MVSLQSVTPFVATSPGARWADLLGDIIAIESQWNFPAGQTLHIARYPGMGTEKVEWLDKLQEIINGVLRRYRTFNQTECGSEDLSQELIIKLLDLPARYPEANDGALGRLAWSACVNHLKDYWIHQECGQRAYKKYAVDVLHPEDTSTIAGEGARLLMASLDPAGQETLKLLLEGRHQSEVARMLGVTRGAIHWRVMAIREKALALGISPDA